MINKENKRESGMELNRWRICVGRKKDKKRVIRQKNEREGKTERKSKEKQRVKKK